MEYFLQFEEFIGNLWVLNQQYMIRYDMPKEVRQFVLILQADLKVKKNNGKFSQQQTINHIIKEYKKVAEKI